MRTLYHGSFRRNQLEIQRIGDDHIRAVVTTPRGRVYAVTIARTVDQESAEPTTAGDIEQIWMDDRAAFLPFNTSTGCYQTP